MNFSHICYYNFKWDFHAVLNPKSDRFFLSNTFIFIFSNTFLKCFLPKKYFNQIEDSFIMPFISIFVLNR